MAQLISVRRNGTDGRHYARFSATFSGDPTDAEVMEAQKKAGYHPAGYGGPYRVEKSPGAPGSGHTVVLWECSGSCD